MLESRENRKEKFPLSQTRGLVREMGEGRRALELRKQGIRDV